METKELAQNLLKLEAECRVLRGEVSLLEKMRRLGVPGAAAIESAPKAEAAARNGKVAKSRGRAPALPIEAVGDLKEKAGEVTLCMQESKRLLAERQKLQAALDAVRADLADAQEESFALEEHLQAVSAGASDFQDPVEFNEVNALKQRMVAALRERECVQATLQRQTAMLREMVSQIAAAKSLDEEKAEAARQLAERREELYSIRSETQSMLRLLERKDRQLENTPKVDELAIAWNAETERRVVSHRLERERENVRLNESSIRHRALQIAKLEKRIEMIGDALNGEEMNTEDRVDAEIIEQLRKEMNSLTRLHREGGARLEILDSDIEDLDRRCTGLVCTTDNIKKEMKRIEKNHRKYTNAQKKELEMEQALAEEEINKLQDDINTLRKFTKRPLPNSSRR